VYNLKLVFSAVGTGSSLSDASGTALDGDADGNPGGAYSFWFESSDQTIFVDKQNDTRANQLDGTGTLNDPYDTISAALDDARLRIIVPTTGGEAIQSGDYILLTDGVNPTKSITFQLGSERRRRPPCCLPRPTRPRRLPPTWRQRLTWLSHPRRRPA